MKLKLSIALAIVLVPAIYATQSASSQKKIPSDLVYRDTKTGIEFVEINGGCFKMGDIFGDGDTDEKPAHRVCLDDYYLGRFEVTQGQWIQIMGNNPSLDIQGEDYPVAVVNKYDVDNYIKKLNQITGRNYRLPTEAEWEYACRSGGKDLRFGTKNDQLSHQTANLEGIEDGYDKSAPVGSYPPNLLGLYDMSGNVSEWTADWYDRNYYSYSIENNPKGANYRKARYYVRRGGSWYNKTRYLRCSLRNWRDPGFHLIDLGFRLAMDPE